MTRLDCWQSALSEYLTSVATTPFAYGRLDCGLFVAGAIEAMTGVDVVPGLRGRYCDRRTAFEAVRGMAGAASMERLAELLTERHGIVEVPVGMAQRGDSVLIGRGRRSSLALVALYGTELLKPGRSCLLRLPLSRATRAWHI